MLSTVRRISVRRRTPYIWRAHATDASSLQTSSSNEERAKIPRVSMARGSIHVRTWEYPASIAETYAILRAIERKYGRIRDFRWMRDADMAQAYQGLLWATFHSPESLELVPRSGDVLHVPTSSIDPTTEGGVGFHELRELLKPSDKVDDDSQLPDYSIMKRVIESGQPEKEGETKQKFLDIKVERALNDTVFYPVASIPTWTMKKRVALSHSILDWGGFAPVQPLFGSKSPYNSDQEDVPVDSERMRRLLNYASQLTGRPDPSFEPPPSPAAEQSEPQAETQTDNATLEDLTPAPLQARAWSLPPPPPDTLMPQSESQTTRSTQQKSTDTKTSTVVSANARKQQMLAKAKKPAQPKLKAQNKGNKKTVKTSAKEEGAESAENAENTGTAEKLTVDKKESQSIPKEKETVPAGMKDKFMGFVQKWF